MLIISKCWRIKTAAHKSDQSTTRYLNLLYYLGNTETAHKRICRGLILNILSLEYSYRLCLKRLTDAILQGFYWSVVRDAVPVAAELSQESINLKMS